VWLIKILFNYSTDTNNNKKRGKVRNVLNSLNNNKIKEVIEKFL